MANSTERMGVYQCGKIAEKNNWMFREQPIDDIGIDAHMELVESTGRPKQLVALQIKSGSSWFKEKKDDLINKRIRNLINSFASAGLNSHQVTNDDLRIILDNFLNGGQTTTFGTVIG